jgi:hypothetical protein
MAWGIEFEVRIPPGLLDPDERWQAGLMSAGLRFREAFQRDEYPPQAQLSTYTRTGALADTIDFTITEFGRAMDLGGPIVASYLLFGTGIHGPTGQPIVPINAKFLAWQNTGGVSLLGPNMKRRAAGGRNGDMIFMKSVAGTIWEGKLEQVLTVVRDGFLAGVLNYGE